MNKLGRKKLLLTIIILLLLSCNSSRESKRVVSNTNVEEVLDIDSIIDDVLNKPLKEIIVGETGYAQNQGLNIWYNSINPGENRETILLLQGSACSALSLPTWFIDGFASENYNVIRLDYRETGLSDIQENWRRNDAYTLEDLGSDAIAVLDKNNIKRFHIIGISMGGMIAQSLAINYPDRVKSVTSIATSANIFDKSIPFGEEIGTFSIRLYMKYSEPITDRDYLEIFLAWFNFHRGSKDRVVGEAEIREMLTRIYYDKVKRRPPNRIAEDHHNMAVYYSGSRMDDLAKIKAPYLAIHGTEDNMVNIKHAKKYSTRIRNCETLWVEGMGHGILKHDYKIILKRLLPFLKSSS